jgi:hypothetical protein
MSWSCFSFIPSVFTTRTSSNASDGNIHTSRSLVYTEPASNARDSTLFKDGQGSSTDATKPGDPYSHSTEQPMQMPNRSPKPSDGHDAGSVPDAGNERGKSQAKSAAKALGAGLAVAGTCLLAGCLDTGKCMCNCCGDCVNICCGSCG